MAFRKVCTLDEVWEGDMASFDVDGDEILVVWPEGGSMKAYQGRCPHQDISLVDGTYDGKVLTCKAHFWTFDSTTGKGINPGHCRLAEYPVRLDGDDVLVETAGVVPTFATAYDKEKTT